MNKKTRKGVCKLVVILIVLTCFAAILFVITKPNNKNEENKLELVEEEAAKKIELKDKANATNEEWMAAGVSVAISMQYSEFEIIDICVSEEEVYIIFNSNGEEKAIHSVPLKEERDEAGTKDLYTKDLGFATFDEVPVEEIEIEKFRQVEIEDLSELIEQSVLVSIYEH